MLTYQPQTVEKANHRAKQVTKLFNVFPTKMVQPKKVPKSPARTQKDTKGRDRFLTTRIDRHLLGIEKLAVDEGAGTLAMLIRLGFFGDTLPQNLGPPAERLQ